MDAYPPRPTRVHRAQIARARELRRNPTASERILWNILRQLGQAHGLHFRRQAPIGPYIVDSCCHRLKVIVEADGEAHDELHDLDRDAWFKRAGYRTIRIPNALILNRDYDLETPLLRRLGFHAWEPKAPPDFSLPAQGRPASAEGA
jgi:very-short-patch-repair endonuclease